MEVSLIPSAPGHSSQHFWADPISFPLKILQVLLLLDEPKNSVWPCPEFFLEDFTKLFMKATCFTVKYLYWHFRHPWVLWSLFFSWRARTASVQILFKTSMKTFSKKNWWHPRFIVPQPLQGSASLLRKAAGCSFSCFCWGSLQRPMGNACLQASSGAWSPAILWQRAN